MGSNAVSERLALHHKFNPTDRRRGISVDRSQVARSKRRQLLAPSRVGYFHSENTRRKNDCPCPLGHGAAAGNRPCEQRTLLRRRKMKSLSDNGFQAGSCKFQWGLLQDQNDRERPDCSTGERASQDARAFFARALAILRRCAAE